jgi:hypothetical protein
MMERPENAAKFAITAWIEARSKVTVILGWRETCGGAPRGARAAGAGDPRVGGDRGGGAARRPRLRGRRAHRRRVVLRLRRQFGRDGPRQRPVGGHHRGGARAVTRPAPEARGGRERDLDRRVVLLQLVVESLVQLDHDPHDVGTELTVADVSDGASPDAVVADQRRDQMCPRDVQDQTRRVTQHEVGDVNGTLHVDDHVDPTRRRHDAHRRDVSRPPAGPRSDGVGGELQRGRGRKDDTEARDQEGSLHGLASTCLCNDKTT